MAKEKHRNKWSKIKTSPPKLETWWIRWNLKRKRLGSWKNRLKIRRRLIQNWPTLHLFKLNKLEISKKDLGKLVKMKRLFINLYWMSLSRFMNMGLINKAHVIHLVLESAIPMIIFKNWKNIIKSWQNLRKVI